MKISADGRKAALVVGFGMLAILVGVVASFVEVKWFLAGVLGAAAVAAVFFDYRFGVLCLTFLLPWPNRVATSVDDFRVSEIRKS